MTTGRCGVCCIAIDGVWERWEPGKLEFISTGILLRNGVCIWFSIIIWDSVLGLNDKWDEDEEEEFSEEISICSGFGSECSVWEFVGTVVGIVELVLLLLLLLLFG